MSRRRILIVLLAASLLQLLQAQENNAPRLPGAQLLVELHSPERLLLTNEHSELFLSEPAGKFRYGDGYACGRTTISSDGNTIVVGRDGPDHVPFTRLPEMIVATYSVQDARWTNHPHLHAASGPVAISPDGSKLAFYSQVKEGNKPEDMSFELRLLDLRIESTTVVTTLPGRLLSLSWAPDNRRIVFQAADHIYVGDTNTGTVLQIGTGRAVSWSPSGEWIAFVACVPSNCQSRPSEGNHTYWSSHYRLTLMSPTGTNIRSLISFHSAVNPCSQPSWSPDSKKILFTKSRNPDEGTFDVYMLEVATGKRQKVFKKTTIVLAWLDTR